MLRAIILQDAKLRDALVSQSSSIRQTDANNGIIAYQKFGVMFLFSEILSLQALTECAISEYHAEEIFVVANGRSIDTEHEIGDVILPNVFLNFSPKILSENVDKNNRDHLMGGAKFLEIFDEHKDYYVENFGISIGGIFVGNTPFDEEISEKLMTVYSADVYSEKNYDEIIDIISHSSIPVVFLVAVSHGKTPKNIYKNLDTFLAENIMTTIRLISEEENL